MIDVKKKLSSFIPSSARAQLQNVLTVEWDTHKTVLVQVPGGGEGSGEVEMEMGGMDRSGRRENYGRLADDDEAEALFNQSNFDASRAHWQANRTSSSSSQRDVAKITKKRAPPPLAPRPYDYQADENPFDETSPSYQASFNQSADSGLVYEYGRGVPGTPEKKVRPAWSSFGETPTRTTKGPGAKQGGVNPWGEGGEWSASATPSPTSSRGTRESALYESENPFR